MSLIVQIGTQDAVYICAIVTCGYPGIQIGGGEEGEKIRRAAEAAGKSVQAFILDILREKI